MVVTRDIAAAVECVRSGGLIAYPTEAVFGLGCDPSRLDSLARLLALKSRPSHKGLILIASSAEQLQHWIRPLSETLLERIEPSWPGPVTWVVPARPDVPERLAGRHEGNTATLAVRVTAHPLVVALCDALGHALVSTSANISGEPPARSVQQVTSRFDGGVDLVLDGELGGLDRPTDIFDALSGRQLR